MTEVVHDESLSTVRWEVTGSQARQQGDEEVASCVVGPPL